VKSKPIHDKVTLKERNYHTHKGSLVTPAQQRNYGPKQSSWYSAGMCFFGFHTGVWAYVSDYCCEQLRECAACAASVSGQDISGMGDLLETVKVASALSVAKSNAGEIRGKYCVQGCEIWA
jgi:hypothetical protein